MGASVRFKTLALLALAIVLLGMTACARETTPEPTGINGVPVQELEARAGDVTLYVRVAGNIQAGNALIAVNGGPGLSSHYMLSLEGLASEEFAVVTYDQRGTGRSTSPSGGYSLLDYVEGLDAVRQAVGVEKVHLLGHSWGGLIAMRYATVYPQRVKSIVLMGSGPPDWQTSRAGQARLSRRIAELQEQGLIPKPIPVDAEYMKAILPAYFADPNFKLPAAAQETQFNATTNQRASSALVNYDFRQDVARLDHPVLMLWGEADPFGLPTAEATLDALAAAQVEWILLRKCGHFWDECPSEFFSHVRTFLGLPPVP